jgi:hypothetical protein
MQPLPEIVNVNGTGIIGLKARLLKRDRNICLYERSDGYFEVFIVQVSPAAEVFGKSYPEREVYPGNDDFGKTAWCFREYKNALKEFQRLTESPKIIDDHKKVDT